MRVFKSNSGFSLIELMIVVAIIGILAAVAVPNFNRFQAKSRQAEARGDMSAIYIAQKAFHQEWQTFFADFREIGYRPEGSFRYEHGFLDAGTPVSPVDYTGAIGGGAAATNFSTADGAQACGADGVFANGCTVLRTYNAATLTSAELVGCSVTATNAFVVGALGQIDDDATEELWTMNQDKQITPPAGGGDLDL